MNWIVWFVKLIVTGVEPTPDTLRTLLNQMNLPCGIAVPLKLDVMEAWGAHEHDADALAVVRDAVLAVVPGSAGHGMPPALAPGYCWQTTSSATSSAAVSTQVVMSPTDAIVWSHGGVESSGHTSHQGGSCVHFSICATFFCSAALIFACATPSGHCP